MVVVACLAAFCRGGVLGQEAGPAAADRQQRPAGDTEEIIVRGRSRAALRVQIELAEEALFDRFNDINSSDEFDIHCYQEPITGSRIPRRSCRANFWREAEARAGEEAVRALQGSASINPQLFQAQALYKSQLLADEMRRLAAEDDELRQAAARLGGLTLALNERGEPAASPTAAAARVVAAGDEALPYDASVIVDVRIGREPWRHTLTRPTFTIANVYGGLGEMELECAGRTARLQYEAGAEWTLPDQSERCTLVIAADSGTTFSLYEF